jgi:hypothetical protein
MVIIIIIIIIIKTTATTIIVIRMMSPYRKLYDRRESFTCILKVTSLHK